MATVDALVVQQIPRLRRYARMLTGDHERADDLVQDCLERAWSRLHLWQAGTDMRAWLFTIMHNIHANQARQHSKAPDFVTLDDFTTIDNGDMAISSLASPESGVVLRQLEAAMTALPTEQRAVLLLVCVEQMKYEQVSQLLSVPVGTVMSRLHRARERLRDVMYGNKKSELRRVK